MQRLFIGFILSVLSFIPAAISKDYVANDIKGVWLTQKESKNAKIEIAACEGNKDQLCGKIIWLQEPNDRAGQPKTDKNNPNSNLKARPLMGLALLSDFTKTSDTTWENGKIYNPEDGELYSCTLTLTHNDKGEEVLEVHGYVGLKLFGKTQYWKRATK